MAGHSFELGGDKPLLPDLAPAQALTASNSYYEWVAAGKPLTPALPIREIVDKLKAAFPKGAARNLFSWYANDAHYQAIPPQDHTPFSATGWPVTSPRWWVNATDIMHRPDLGVDCNVLFPYWLAEAKAGRTPWVKYYIWQSKLYDVRNNWVPTANSDHFDHIHLSTRTDYLLNTTGSWSIVPGGDDPMLIRINETGAIWTVDAARVWRRDISNVAELASWKGAPLANVSKSELDKGWWGIDYRLATQTGSGGGGLVDHTHGVAASETGGAVTP